MKECALIASQVYGNGGFVRDRGFGRVMTRLGVHHRAVTGKHYTITFLGRGLTRVVWACGARTNEGGGVQGSVGHAGSRGRGDFVARSSACGNLKSFRRTRASRVMGTRWFGRRLVQISARQGYARAGVVGGAYWYFFLV